MNLVNNNFLAQIGYFAIQAGTGRCKLKKWAVNPLKKACEIEI